MKRFALWVTAVTLFGLSGHSRAQTEWQVAPYLWMSDVSLDLTLNDRELGGTVPFSDIVDKLDGAFMIRAEGRGSGSGVGGFFDMITITLRDGSVTPVGPGGPVLGDLVTSSKLSMGLFDAGLTLRFGDLEADRFVLDILGGIRYVDVEQDIAITLPGPLETMISRQIDATEVDLLIGARGVGKLSDRWHYRLRGDYSNFGTDGTLNLLAAIGYSFGQTGLFSLDVGYRHLMMELSNNLDTGSSSSDIELSGPIVGFVFSF